jgi:hypothetical protein
MLNLEEKIVVFTSFLSQEEISYADSYNWEILIFAQNFDFKFLEKLASKNKIEKWIEKLKSRIVMREDDAILDDIIVDYILCW